METAIEKLTSSTAGEVSVVPTVVFPFERLPSELRLQVLRELERPLSTDFVRRPPEYKAKSHQKRPLSRKQKREQDRNPPVIVRNKWGFLKRLVTAVDELNRGHKTCGHDSCCCRPIVKVKDIIKFAHASELHRDEFIDQVIARTRSSDEQNEESEAIIVAALRQMFSDYEAGRISCAPLFVNKLMNKEATEVYRKGSRASLDTRGDLSFTSELKPWLKLISQSRMSCGSIRVASIQLPIKTKGIQSILSEYPAKLKDFLDELHGVSNIAIEMTLEHDLMSRQEWKKHGYPDREVYVTDFVHQFLKAMLDRAHKQPGSALKKLSLTFFGTNCHHVTGVAEQDEEALRSGKLLWVTEVRCNESVLKFTITNDANDVNGKEASNTRNHASEKTGNMQEKTKE